MKLNDLVQQTNWAIIPSKLDAINQVLYNHMHGIKIDLDALAASGTKLENSYNVTVTADGLAIVPIHGIIAKRMNFFMEISGGVSTEYLKRDIRLAIEDEDVKAILLDIDSPGGTVDGTEAIADFIYESRGSKPIIAFANGLMASAAYWIGSAADFIITEETGEVGSIGVVMCHYDYSKYDEKIGLKRTYIYSGKYKTMGNNAEPLSREAEDYLQEGTDYIYTIFVDTVARNRNVSVDTVLKNMADGKIFIGQQAVDAGLVDELGSYDYAVTTALDLAEENIELPKLIKKLEESNMALNKETKKGNGDVTLKTLEAEHPDLIQQARNEGVESVDNEKHLTEAVIAEKDRILGLAAIQFGEEAGEQFKTVVTSGVTVEQFKAVRGATPLAKGGEKQTEMLKAIKEAGAKNPGAGDVHDSEAGKDFMSLVEAHMDTANCSKAVAIKAVQSRYPKAHEAWIMSRQKGSNVTMH